MAELTGSNGRFQVKNLGDTIKGASSVKRPLKVTEDPGTHGGPVDASELEEAKRPSKLATSSKTYEDKPKEKEKEKEKVKEPEKSKFSLPFGLGSSDKDKDKEYVHNFGHTHCNSSRNQNLRNQGKE